jgi:DNA-binding Xre family transcriptional regulator
MKKRNFIKLRRLAEDQGLELQELAEQAGIGKRTLHTRLEDADPGKSWRAAEITALCKVLHIPQEQIGEYFFPAIAKEEKTA